MANHVSRPRRDLCGLKFGRLTPIKYEGRSRWLCKCDCGGTVVVKTDSLNSGMTKSCGCLLKDYMREKATKHGGSEDPLYHVLNAMHQRCENPRCKDYKWYGAEGKTVCDEWSLENYPVFKEWALSTGYKSGLTIDRIDPGKGYSPDNCRWITIQAQQSNKRAKRF